MGRIADSGGIEQSDGSFLHQRTHTLVKGYSMPALIHRIVSLPRRMRADIE
jgi:hypothetical protein